VVLKQGFTVHVIYRRSRYITSVCFYPLN